MKLSFEQVRDKQLGDSELMNIYSYPHYCQSEAFYQYLTDNIYNYPRPGKQSYIKIYDQTTLVGRIMMSRDDSGKLASWYSGPVVKPEYFDRYVDIFVQTTKFLKSIGVKKIHSGAAQIFYDKPNGTTFDASVFSFEGETVVIDLREDLKTIRSGFDRSVKKNEQRCLKSGVEIRFIDKGDTDSLDQYLKLLAKFRGILGFPMPPFYPNIQTMNLFSGKGYFMEIALGVFNKKILSGLGFVGFGKIVTEIAALRTEDYSLANLPVNDLMKVAAIERFKQKGMVFYDITGGKKYPEDTKEQNINKFKRKFSSQTRSYGYIWEKRLVSPLSYVFS